MKVQSINKEKIFIITKLTKIIMQNMRDRPLPHRKDDTSDKCKRMFNITMNQGNVN